MWTTIKSAIKNQTLSLISLIFQGTPWIFDIVQQKGAHFLSYERQDERIQENIDSNEISIDGIH